MTSAPAKAIHRETTLGSIGVGREADVTILKVDTLLASYLKIKLLIVVRL